MNTARLSGWPLFWVCVSAYLAALAVGFGLSDPSTSGGAEFLVKHSVRCALPYFILAFTASSLVQLMPSAATRWLRANRRYIGLAFAAGMACHLTLVAYALYRFPGRLSLRDLVQDATGVVFLILLTLTSFRVAARHLTTGNWRRLHKIGVYVIWALATHIYFGILRREPAPVDVAFFAVLIAAWLVRIAAWTTDRTRHRARMAAAGSSS